MEFRVENGKVSLIRKSKIICLGWNRITGRCKVHNLEKLKICKLYKCKLLNFFSKLLNQPIWNWEWQ